MTYPITPTQCEHDAVGAALAAYEQALDHVDDLLEDNAAEDELAAAQEDVDNMCELLAAARETSDAAHRRLVPTAPAPPAETAWLRDVNLEW
jgi:hypothetical protein